MSSSLQLHGLQHTRPSCPSPTPRVYSNSCPLNQWCHPLISPSVVPFSSHLQSFPASGSFQRNQFLTSGGQSIGVSASASVLPMNTQGWSPLGWSVWISLQSKGLSLVFSSTTTLMFFYGPTLTSIHAHIIQFSHLKYTIQLFLNGLTSSNLTISSLCLPSVLRMIMIPNFISLWVPCHSLFVWLQCFSSFSTYESLGDPVKMQILNSVGLV